MRYSKRYLVFLVLLLAVFFLKQNTWNDEYAEVNSFRGASLQAEVFYPLKAMSINEEGLVSLAQGEEVYDTSDGVLMGDEMELLVSLDFAQELFGCSAKLYDDSYVKVLFNGTTYTFPINEARVIYDDETKELSASAELHSGVAYLPLADLSELFACEYTYNAVNYQGMIASDSHRGELPDTFDLREVSRATAVRNQGSASTCWAEAALTALETTLLPTESFTFSVDHMVSDNNFGLDESAGGEYTMAVAYLLSWTGPVENGVVQKHVQEVHFYDEDDLEEIKWAVYQYGGVSTSIYAEIATTNLSKSSYYNSKTNSYYYDGDEAPNHDVVIIGWDDSYSADNFSNDVPGDGAFVCQNSWGATFGDDGVFYVSYYDTNIGDQAVSYQVVEDTDNYDNIYQSDLCGWSGQVGYGKSKIHGAIVYEAENDEEIVAAGFYALGEDTEYQVYIVPEYEGVSSLANRVEVASGTLSDAGYYTISFDRSYSVSKGQKFAIVLVIDTPGKEYPLAVEYQSDEMRVNVDISDGESYISNNGLDWESVEEMAEGNLCIKAYSRKTKALNNQ